MTIDHDTTHDVSLADIVGRYLSKRAAALSRHYRRPLTAFELASAALVWFEVFGGFHWVSPAQTLAGCLVHPVAASATLLALVAHAD